MSEVVTAINVGPEGESFRLVTQRYLAQQALLFEHYFLFGELACSPMVVRGVSYCVVCAWHRLDMVTPL